MRIVRCKTMSKAMQLFAVELSELLTKHQVEISVGPGYGDTHLIFDLGPEEVTVFGEINGSDEDFDVISVEVAQHEAEG